jgi:serine O-acetyltransferase
VNKLRLDVERYYVMRGRVRPLSSLQLVARCLNPRLMPNVLLRAAEFFHEHHLGLLAKICAALNVLFFGIEVSPLVEIGGGLSLPHTVGTVLGAASIGKNCTILQGVTLGSIQPDMGFTKSSRPVIGNHVYIGAGAKVIGSVMVGDHAKIGANAVVLCDVPEHAVAVGVPAKIKLRSVVESKAS